MPTATVVPNYDLSLELIGDDDFKKIFTDTNPVTFELNLTNLGNITDTFKVKLVAAPSEGWTAEYCIGDSNSCSDYTVPETQVTLPADGSQGLFVKLTADSNTQVGDQLSVILEVQSLGNETRKASKTVTVVVTKP
jgi:uncharacterized membrane protein